MAENNLKKTLLFSSLEKKEFVDAILEDEHKVVGRKVSAKVEEIILDSLLTKNNQIRFWIKDLYNGSTSEDVLYHVFDFNSAGVNWKSCDLPLLPFIEFAINEQKYIKEYEVEKKQISSLLKSFDSIRNIFENLKRENTDDELVERYENAINIIDAFSDQLNDPNEKIQFISFYRFFKEYWSELKDSTHTFRALSDLAIMQKGWRNDSESRYALTKCLRDLALNWPEGL